MDEAEDSVNECGNQLRLPQRLTLEAVRQYLDDHGEPNPGGTGFPEPERVKMAGREGLQEFLAGKQSATELSERRKQAGRKLDRLIEAGVVQQNHGFVWIIERSGSRGS